MPRFTLQQLLVCVLLGCVYLAVLREAFGEVKYAVVAIFAWLMLAAFYFNVRLRFILVAHSLTPMLAMILLLGYLVSPIFEWAQITHSPFALFVTTCRTTSIVMFPLAVFRLMERRSKKL